MDHGREFKIDNDFTPLIARAVSGSLKCRSYTRYRSELLTTGKMKYYEELREETPPCLLEMLTISSLGPKKIRLISEKLRIRTIAELEKACLENRLLSLAGFGKKTQDKRT